jgi:hypothetical protein
VRGPSHPPGAAQSFFTQPTPDASQSVTRDVRFTQVSTA